MSGSGLRALGVTAGTALALALGALAPVAGQQPPVPTARRGFSIEITEPADQGIVLGRQRIAATVEAGDPAVVERVEFLVDERVVFVDRERPYEFVHDFGEQAGSHVVRAVAWHREGVSVADSIVTRRVLISEVARVNRVVLWVTATHDDGWLVHDLTASEFEVLEEGRPQRVLEFYREDRPLALALVLDSSGSMREVLDEVHAAAAGFVGTLRPEDRALVLDFDDKVFLVQDMTSDRERLQRAIASTEAIGGTAIHDALRATYRKLAEVEGRKAIILLTDGEDTHSQIPFERALEQARASNAVIFAIALGMGDRSQLKRFAETTGGRMFAVQKASELAGVYARIAEELRAQYFLTYETANQTFDGRFVKVEVRTRRPDVDLRARAGYYAIKQ